MSEENDPQATQAVPNHCPRQTLITFTLVGYTEEEAASSCLRRVRVPFIRLSLKCSFLQETNHNTHTHTQSHKQETKTISQ